MSGPRSEHIAALKALSAAQRDTASARNAAINQIKALLADAPSEIQHRYRRHTLTSPLVRALARSRPNGQESHAAVAVLNACKALAQRIEFLDRQSRDLTAHLQAFLSAVTPVGSNGQAESA